MQIFGTIEKIAKRADGSLKVTGIASSEVKDKHGEVVLSSAIADALPDFFRHGTGALREMHSPAVAAGTVDEIEIDDDHKTHIVATVVDAEAIKKIKAGVYKSYSIGGRVLARDPDDRKVITAIELNEISLVDVGANPEAKLELFKTVAGGALTDGIVDERLAKVLADRGRLAKQIADRDRALEGLADRVERTMSKVSEIVARNKHYRNQNAELTKKLAELQTPRVIVDNVIARADQVLGGVETALADVKAKTAVMSKRLEG